MAVKRLSVCRFLSSALVMLLILSSFSVPTRAVGALGVWREPPSGFMSASDVEYVKEGDYVANWGVRGEHATFLSEYARDYYTGDCTYENFITHQGNANIDDTPASDLFTALSDSMNAKCTYITSYSDTCDLYKYTDCMVNNYNYISSFYSGEKLNGEWDGARTWNREHVWPDSKIEGESQDDIMMLRPTSVKENSARGNMAYGESSGYFDPNTVSDGGFNLHGDCARILLYTYVRWKTTSSVWGESGVIENLDILLKWMEEDPVDTWEMGRNDAVQSITGVRNVFVDYPELSWLLFDRQIPENYVSPSSVSAESGHTYIANVTEPTCTEKGYTTYSCPICGSSFVGSETAANGHVDVDEDGKCDICGNTLADEAPKFKLYTDAVTEGDYLIVSDGSALAAAAMENADRLAYAEVTEGDSIATDNAAIIFHISEENGYWTIYNADAGKYVSSTGLKNKAVLSSDSSDKTLWTASMADGKYEFVNKYNREINVNSYLRCNGTYGWACYSTSTGGSLTLYKKDENTEPEPPTTCTVTWANYDGTILETDENVSLGELPSYDGETPVRPSDSEYTYTFAGWDNDVNAELTGDLTFTALFNAEEIEPEPPATCTVTWANYDGTILETDENVSLGELPSYDGEIPVRPSDSEYTYTFAGWDNDVNAELTGDITFTAVFYAEEIEPEPSAETYTVTWKNYDGTILETDKNVSYGELPSYDGKTPSRSSDNEYTYTFAGWDKDVKEKVTGDITFTAVFDAKKRTVPVSEPVVSVNIAEASVSGSAPSAVLEALKKSVYSYEGIYATEEKADIVSALGISAAAQEKMEEIIIEKFLRISETVVVKFDGATALRAEITPMKRYKVTYTDDSDPTVSSAVGEEVTKPVTVSLSVGEAFINSLSSSTVYVNHKGKYQYGAKVSDGKIRFTTGHGFSLFEVTTVDSAIARVGNIGFFSLQDAVDEMTENGTLAITTVARGNLSAVVAREISITVTNAGSAAVTLKPASGYEMTVKGNVYTFRKADSDTSTDDTSSDSDDDSSSGRKSSGSSSRSSSGSSSGSSSNSVSANTSDDSSAVLWTVLGVLAVIGTGATLYFRKRCE